MSRLTHYLTTPLALLALAGLLNAADAAAQQGPPPPAFLTTVRSSQSFDQTVKYAAWALVAGTAILGVATILLVIAAW